MIEALITIMFVCWNLCFYALFEIAIAYFWVCTFDMKAITYCDPVQLQKTRNYSVTKSNVIAFLVGLTILPAAIVYWWKLYRERKKK
jgi:hypothetical protein